MKYLFLFLLSAFHRTVFSAGFIAGTLVKVPFGHIAIEQIQPGSQILGLNTHKFLGYRTVTDMTREKSKKLIKITIANELLLVSPDQQFFSSTCIIKASQIEPGMEILGSDLPLTVDNIEVIERPSEVYTLCMDDIGIFYVSKYNVAVTNCPYKMLKELLKSLNAGVNTAKPAIEVVGGMGMALLSDKLGKMLKDEWVKRKISEKISQAYVNYSPILYKYLFRGGL